MRLTILYGITIFALVAVQMAQSISPKPECSSSNDPHMINFNNVPFEFHYAGKHCLYNSNHVTINAGFNNCYAGSTIFCNCLLEIILPSGDYVRINTCNGLSSDVSTINVALDCLDPIAQNSLFDEAYWNSLTAFHPLFKCATTPSNAIAVRTTLTQSGNDVLVLVYKSSNAINQIKVYASDQYALNSMKNVDKCLCGNYTSFKYPIVLTNQIKINADLVKRCRALLVDECLNANIFPNLNREQVKKIDKLVEDCALDAQGKVKQIGMFQRDFFEANIYEDLLVNFKEDLENDCNFSLANGKVLEMVTAFCKCRGKLPNKVCLINGRCKTPFGLCR